MSDPDDHDTNVYRREWKAIRDELSGTAEGQHLAIRLGLELLQDITEDPLYRAAVEHRDRVAEYHREQRERRRLLTMDAGDRLTHAKQSGETTVHLTPEQARPFVGYRCIEVADVDERPPSWLVDDATDPRDIPCKTATWDLAWWSDRSAVATLKQGRGRP
jgi:hypothetical protein